MLGHGYIPIGLNLQVILGVARVRVKTVPSVETQAIGAVVEMLFGNGIPREPESMNLEAANAKEKTISKVFVK